MPFVNPTGPAAVNIQDILAEFNQASQGARKDSRIARELHHQKSMRFLDGQISQLKAQQSRMGSSALLQFFTNMFTQLLNVAATVLGMVLQPTAAIITQISNRVLQTVLQGIAILDPHAKKARELGVQAEEQKKNAEAENHKTTIAGDHIRNEEESLKLVTSRLEKALDNIHGSREVVLKA